MINRKVFREIRDFFEGHYTVNALNNRFMKSRNFIAKHEDLCIKEGASPKEVSLVASKSLNKKQKCTLLAIPYASKKLFNAFLDFLPPDVKVVFKELIWHNQLTYKDIEKMLNISICNKSRQNNYYRRTEYKLSLKSGYEVFEIIENRWWRDQQYTLLIPMLIRRVVVKYFDRPEGAELVPLDKIEKMPYMHLGESAIFLELSRIISYVQQNEIKATKKKKPQAGSVRKMRQKLSLKEFYEDTPNKDLNSLRTALLAALILTESKPQSFADAVEKTKNLIHQNYLKYFDSTHGILTYLYGTGSVNKYGRKSIEKDLFSILKKLPLNQWVSIENIETFIKYNFYEIKPVDDFDAKEKLYYSVNIKTDEGTLKDYEYIQAHRYHKSLVLPTLKGTFFLFSAYGLLDVTYDAPDTSEMGITAQSPYDGLKYIRLNNFGNYVIGNTEEYELPDAIVNSSISLSDDSLTITIDESDLTAPIILEPYTDKVSPNRYRTNYTFFLKGTKNKKELEDKISLFKQSIKVKLPPNWEQFFDEIRQKIDPLIDIDHYSIFQIPESNKELRQLIAKDPVLQKITLKAEGFHILVDDAHLLKFKNRLQEFGFLMA